ncbi:ionotropic receptor 25a-like [Ornithodoros turicata]|uniref:ionotropic receptor 25a-like n=1 Tax=Ornithodoros turicata TaxID=34597 RepID=UPI003138827B
MMGMLQNGVWLILLLALVFLSFVTTAFSLWTPQKKHRKSILFTWSDELWRYVENMFTEASAHCPVDAPTRIVVAVWWIAVVVLMNAFTGLMRACMMLKTETNTIDSIRELVLQPNIKPYVWGGTAYIFMLRDTGTPEYQAVWKIVERHRSMLTTERLYSKEILTEVLRGKAVIVSDRSSIVHKVSLACNQFTDGEFYLSSHPVTQHPFVWYYNRRLAQPIRDAIDNKLISLLEAGLTQRWWQQGVGDWSRCKQQTVSASAAGSSQLQALRFADMKAIFVLWLLCVGIALAVFVFEIILHRPSQPKRVVVCSRHQKLHPYRTGLYQQRLTTKAH